MHNRYDFHLNLYGVPSAELHEAPIMLGSKEFNRLVCDDAAAPIFDQPFSVTWEYAAERLEALHRMIFEPDGSFVWSGDDDNGRWQVDGHLFDFSFQQSAALHRVELRGTCPKETFDTLLQCLGWPEATLMFEMAREGVLMDEENFRKVVG